MVQVTVQTEAHYRTRAAARQHTWYADASETDADSAPNPEEIFLSSLGACMAMTAKMYANRKGWALEGVQIELSLERMTGAEYPGYQGDAQFVHEIREKITLQGDLDDQQKARLMEIIGKCPVRRVVTSPVFFVETLIDAEAQPE